jgi:23S rRNA (guanine745-N1)-methyltransferase
MRDGRRMVCARNHSFDVAASGYINLLQPQDRRSRHPGDSRDAVAARRRFLDRGFAAPLLEAMLPFLPPARTVLDVGCGEGYHLGAFQRSLAAEAHGLDISAPAIDSAARRYRDCTFVVANADRFLPYADRSFDLVTSITSRVNAAEFSRVLRGSLFLALPGPDDLIELREAVLGEGKLVDRARDLDGFAVVRRERISHKARLDAAAIRDVMTSSYRGLRDSQRDKLERLSALDVTLSRDLLILRRS